MSKTKSKDALPLSYRARRFWQGSLQRIYQQEALRGRLDGVYRGPRHVTFKVRLADSTAHKRAVKVAESFALDAGVKNIVSMRYKGHIIYQIELPNTYWKSYTRDDCEGLVIGFGDMKRPVEFGFSPPHTLVAGTTDSGKTETEKSIITALAQNYTPEQMQLIIVDPHHDYEEFSNLAHLVGPIASDGNDIRAAIGYASKILIYRRSNNLRIDKVPDLPRVVLAIDEADANIVLKYKENVTDVAALASEARKFGVNLIVGVQKPTHQKMPDILDKLNHKLVGLVDDAGLSARLTGRDGMECHKLTGYGDFIQIRGSHVVRFQVAQALPDTIEKLDKGLPTSWDNVENDWTEKLMNLPPSKKDEVEDELVIPEKSVGRPSLTLDMRLLARYIAHGPNHFSQATARKLLSPIAGFEVTRGVHTLHRDAAVEFMEEYKNIGPLDSGSGLVIGEPV